MEVVSKEVSADIAPVSVIDPKEGTLGPDSALIDFLLGLHYVQDNGDPIFIIVPRKT